MIRGRSAPPFFLLGPHAEGCHLDGQGAALAQGRLFAQDAIPAGEEKQPTARRLPLEAPSASIASVARGPSEPPTPGTPRS